VGEIGSLGPVALATAGDCGLVRAAAAQTVPRPPGR